MKSMEWQCNNAEFNLYNSQDHSIDGYVKGGASVTAARKDDTSPGKDFQAIPQ
jgi:hypothetical protein